MIVGTVNTFIAIKYNACLYTVLLRKLLLLLLLLLSPFKLFSGHYFITKRLSFVTTTTLLFFVQSRADGLGTIVDANLKFGWRVRHRLCVRFFSAVPRRGRFGNTK